VSPSDQALEVRLTLSRGEAIAFLKDLAQNSTLRERFESGPYEVLSEHGIEVTPAEAVPSTVVAPNPEDIESAIDSLGPEPVEGWNAQRQWANFPLIGLLAKPMESGASETP
jgi:hypothetical protein